MTGCIVVAAGYGSLREKLGIAVPKVLECVGKVPMIIHPLRLAEQSGIADSVVVVNPRDKEAIVRGIEVAFRAGVIQCMPDFVVQERRLGSADAVSRAIPLLQSKRITRAIVTYGDMPCWSADTWLRLRKKAWPHHTVTMVIATRSYRLPALDRYGRILRDGGGICGVMEVNDPAVTDEVRAIPHVNPSLWLWDLQWLESAIPRVVPVYKADGHGDERYMPPLIAMAYDEERVIGEVPLTAMSSAQALGVNTTEELAAARSLVGG